MPTSHGINDITSLTLALPDYPFPGLPYFLGNHLLYDPFGKKINGSGLKGPVSSEGVPLSSVASTTDKALHLAEQWSSASDDHKSTGPNDMSNNYTCLADEWSSESGESKQIIAPVPISAGAKIQLDSAAEHNELANEDTIVP